MTSWHAEAVRVGSRTLHGVRINDYRGSALGIPCPFSAEHGPTNWQGSVRYVEGIETDPGIQVMEQSHQTFLAGLALYKARPADTA